VHVFACMRRVHARAGVAAGVATRAHYSCPLVERSVEACVGRKRGAVATRCLQPRCRSAAPAVEAQRTLSDSGRHVGRTWSGQACCRRAGGPLGRRTRPSLTAFLPKKKRPRRYLAVSRLRSVWTLPLCLCAILAVFYAVMAATGSGLDDARAGG
jgi:hypothetical protein